MDDQRSSQHADEADAAETPIYVVATQPDPTRHALVVAKRWGKPVVIVVPPERIAIRSVRAHDHTIPVDDLAPSTAALLETIRALVATDAPDAHVLVGSDGGLRHISHLLPRGATIVLSGPVRHFLETAEQHLARQLTTRGHEVVFLPSTS